MDDEGRRCAFPGCGVEIQIAHGRPERRYCTAAHRAAARRARRAVTSAQRHRVAAVDPGAVAPARRSREAARPRRCALALHGEASDALVRRTTAALAAVDRRLDLLAQTEEQWRQLPVSRSGVVPAPVTALAERRAMLQARRAALRSQLAALRGTQQDLAGEDDEVIEERNAARPSPTRLREAAAEERSTGAHPAAPDPRSTPQGSRRSGPAARPFDPHAGYLRLSRALAGTASRP